VDGVYAGVKRIRVQNININDQHLQAKEDPVQKALQVVHLSTEVVGPVPIIVVLCGVVCGII
jgi:hypothetical protein